MKKLQIILFFTVFFLANGVSQSPSLRDVYFFSLYGFGIGSIAGEDILIYAPNANIKYTVTDIEFDNAGYEKSKKIEDKYLFFYDQNTFGYSDHTGVHNFLKKIVASEAGYTLYVYDVKGILTRSENFFFKEYLNTLEILSEDNHHGDKSIENNQVFWAKDKIIQQKDGYEIYYFNGNNWCLLYKVYFEENIPVRIDNYTEYSAYEPERVSYSSFYDKSGKVVLQINYDETGEIKYQKKYIYDLSTGKKSVTSTEFNHTFEWFYKEDATGHMIYERHEYNFAVSIKTILPCDIEGNVLYSVENLAVDSTKHTKINEPAILKYRPLILIGISALIILSIVLVLLKKRKHNE